MRTIYLENDLFYEDEVKDTKSIISKYFTIEPIDFTSFVMSNRRLDFANDFRASLNVAKAFGRKFEYANAMKWATYFREYILQPYWTNFNDLKSLEMFGNNHTFEDMFIRPCDGFKDFSGQVFGSREKFLNEYNFMVKNKNVDPYTMCMMSPKTIIENEYRCIFVDGKYISGSKYMSNGEKDLSEIVPFPVVDFANKLSNTSYFYNIPNFVIDVAFNIAPDFKQGYNWMPDIEIDRIRKNNRIMFEGRDHSCYLIEINAFETASFYEADLDLIYSEWAKQ